MRVRVWMCEGVSEGGMREELGGNKGNEGDEG